ncbi:MAG TPA: VOC family protein [Flavobacterium sp.]|jgi:catechol-2,3-dioxygenase
MRIKEIDILTTDIAGTEAFYSGIFNFRTAEKNASSISFEIGYSRLVFSKTDIPNPVYHFAFDIPHNKVDEALEWLSARASIIKFQNEDVVDFTNWNAKSFYFLDNNGNVVEFIARFDNDNRSDQPFDCGSIVSISEIAFVTPDVNELVKKLINEKGLSYFHRPPQRDDFSVLGEDDGLLIIMDSKRKWFPTQIQVASFPLKATIEYNGETMELQRTGNDFP